MAPPLLPVAISLSTSVNWPPVRHPQACTCAPPVEGIRVADLLLHRLPPARIKRRAGQPGRLALVSVPAQPGIAERQCYALMADPSGPNVPAVPRAPPVWSAVSGTVWPSASTESSASELSFNCSWREIWLASLFEFAESPENCGISETVQSPDHKDVGLHRRWRPAEFHRELGS